MLNTTDGMIENEKFFFSINRSSIQKYIMYTCVLVAIAAKQHQFVERSVQLRCKQRRLSDAREKPTRLTDSMVILRITCIDFHSEIAYSL